MTPFSLQTHLRISRLSLLLKLEMRIRILTPDATRLPKLQGLSALLCPKCRFGVQLCPVCMGDPKDPLALPCGHIYCLACIRQWLGPGQMYCPLCMQDVPDDFRLQPSEEIQYESIHSHISPHLTFIDVTCDGCTEH